jgi:hypothetical protein
VALDDKTANSVELDAPWPREAFDSSSLASLHGSKLGAELGPGVDSEGAWEAAADGFALMT